MPRQNQPTSLQNLAIGVLCKKFHALATMLCKPSRRRLLLRSFWFGKHNFEDLRIYLYSGLPEGLAEQLATEILASIADEVKRTGNSSMTLYELTKSVANFSISKLDVTEWPDVMLSVFCQNLLEFTNLRSLKMQALGTEQWLYKGLYSLKNLVEFTFRDNCSDSILQIISTSSKLIQKLDISWSDAVTDRGVNYLISLNNLKMLNINETGISLDGCSQLLINIPKLQKLIFSIYVNTERLFIDKLKILTDSGSNLALKYLRIIEPRDAESLLTITNMCPSLEHIELITASCNLLSLTHLKYLKELTLDYSYLKSMQNIEDLLGIIGSKIKSFSLLNAMNVDLYRLGKLCPNLKHLTLIHCTVFVDRTWHFYEEKSLFVQIEKIKCVSLNQSQLFQTLDMLLPQVTNLKFIILDLLIALDDHKLISILTSYKLEKLEKLIFRGKITFSSATIKFLIKHFENLKHIGNAEFWENISKTDLKYLRQDLKYNNLDISII